MTARAVPPLTDDQRRILGNLYDSRYPATGVGDGRASCREFDRGIQGLKRRGLVEHFCGSRTWAWGLTPRGRATVEEWRQKENQP